ncbi:voltage-dependent anion-selective channel [Nilaparvata lugens]|uniref:voltage-dependent anion-selective channel n=1 Tax=Nilaparvata lugens TaxID=108931 RepID=UPI00193CC529|nr:voltage-dependent anion-selective channel [Nilaparvata lugens]
MSGKFCNPWTHGEGGLPYYAELGKKIRDVFGAYAVGLFNMNVSGVMTDYGIKFSDGLHANKETGDVFGVIETKFASEQKNIIFGQKWTSNNDLSGEFLLIDFCQGALAKLVGTFNTKNNKKSLLIGTDYRNNRIALNLAAEFKDKSPIVKGAIAGGYENFGLGYFTHFESKDSKFVTHDFRVSYDAEKFTLLGALENEFKVISAAIQGRLVDNVDGALEVKHSKGGDNDGVLVTVGVKYTHNEDCVLRGKVDSKAMLGLSLTQTINDTTAISLCAMIEGQNISKGKHQLGFGLNVHF